MTDHEDQALQLIQSGAPIKDILKLFPDKEFGLEFYSMHWDKVPVPPEFNYNSGL